MELYLAEQTMAFLQSLLVGGLLGVLYDFFRVSRVAFTLNSVIIFVEDVCFFLMCGIVTFGFMLQQVDGRIRFFILIGELIGFTLYYFTLGKLVMSVSKAIIRIIKAICRFIYRFILWPVWWLVYHIVTILLVPFHFLRKIFKKSIKGFKYRLKTRYVLLYNQYKGFRGKNKGKQKARESKRMIRKKKPAKNLILRLVLLAFVVYASVVLIDMQVSVGERKKELVSLQAQYEEQRVANKELERQLAVSDDQEYIERIARDKSDFVYPDERVFIDISGS